MADEIFTEVRCPACIPLGYDNSRLLLKVSGEMKASEARIQIRCHRCKSLIEWRYGLPKLDIIKQGNKNPTRRNYAAFE